jgi:hypothetical protein
VKTAKAHQEKRNPQKSKAGSALLFEMKDNKKRKNESKNARKGPENPRKPWTASEGREMSGGVSRELGLRTLQVFSGSYIADFSEPHGQDINRTAYKPRGMGERARHQSLTKTRAAGGARPPKSLLLLNSGGGVGWGGVEWRWSGSGLTLLAVPGRCFKWGRRSSMGAAAPLPTPLLLGPSSAPAHQAEAGFLLPLSPPPGSDDVRARAPCGPGLADTGVGTCATLGRAAQQRNVVAPACGPTTYDWKRRRPSLRKKYNNKSHLYKLSYTVVESPRNKYQSILSRSYIDVTRSIQKLLDGDFAVSWVVVYSPSLNFYLGGTSINRDRNHY